MTYFATLDGSRELSGQNNPINQRQITHVLTLRLRQVPGSDTTLTLLTD